jgi:hypothetical protein
LRRIGSGRADVFIIVKPETVLGWRRAALRFWRWRSRLCGGRLKISEEVRHLIRRLAQENADWGASKISGAAAAVVGVRWPSQSRR